MPYLSRLILDPRSRGVRRDLADCQNLHRTVLSAYPQVEGDARERFGVLYRLEPPARDTGRVVLLVQSHESPDWTKLPSSYLVDMGEDTSNPATKSLDAAYGALEPGMALRFRLRANPTKKIDTKSGPGGERRNGRRVALRGDEARLAWLARKAANHGFRVVSVRGRPDVPAAIAGADQREIGWQRGQDGKVARLTFDAVVFDGSLVVTDAERFRSALEEGIGPAKAYGFGLLSIGPGG
jgi:CRISPR system Cascade subunit CasE